MAAIRDPNSDCYPITNPKAKVPSNQAHRYAEKDLPQPQVWFALGFVN